MEITLKLHADFFSTIIIPAKEVMFSVFLSVCQQDNAKTTGPIFMKRGSGV